MLRKAFYPQLESSLNQWAGFFQKKGFTPNQLTLAGLALNFIAGWIYSSGHFFLGGLVMLLAALGDMLDGPLARLTGKSSKFGAFLDSTVDRYSDFFLFGGLTLYFSNQNETGWLFITLGIILGAYVTSYTKARAENLIESCDVGVFERPERIIGLALLSFFSVLMPLLLWVLFIGTNATALHRILHTRSRLSESSS